MSWTADHENWIEQHSKQNFWFACDVTKNQTNKLSILLSLCFHELLQFLNTFI